MNDNALTMTGNKSVKAGEEETSTDFRPAWRQRNASGLADFFAALSGTAVYFLLALLLLAGFNFFKPDSIVVENFPRIMGMIAAVAILAFVLTVVFERQSRTYEAVLEENTEYLLSNDSIETLSFAGVPEDVTNNLTKILEEARLPELTGDWLKTLEKKLGPARFQEFEPVIRKYTRREKK
ncbi:MAG: hypothetical protein JSS81_29240 [Acidobacteria bacterium]|nr:hypothetical protein [Acidobacteriota bacterium]